MKRGEYIQQYTVIRTKTGHIRRT